VIGAFIAAAAIAVIGELFGYLCTEETPLKPHPGQLSRRRNTPYLAARS
jgi:hypothetical protein